MRITYKTTTSRLTGTDLLVVFGREGKPAVPQGETKGLPGWQGPDL